MAKINGNDVLFSPFIHETSVDQIFDGESPRPQSGKAVAKALTDAVLLNAVGKNEPDTAATPHTVPKRDSNASINVGIAIKDDDGNNYVGAAVPHTYMNKRFSDTNTWVQNASASATGAYNKAAEALESIADINNLISTLSQTVTNVSNETDAKKITFTWNSEIALKPSCLYLLRASGKDVIRIKKQDGTDVPDSDGGTLRPSKLTGGYYDGSRLMFLVIPKNISDNYYASFAVGMPESYTRLMGKSFYWYPDADGQIKAQTTDGSGMMIWEIKL